MAIEFDKRGSAARPRGGPAAARRGSGRGVPSLACLVLAVVLAGCGKAEYERRLEATVDNLSEERMKQVQESQGKPAADASKVLEGLRGSGRAPAATPPAGAAQGQNPNQAAATGAAQGTGLSPVGQSIVAPLE